MRSRKFAWQRKFASILLSAALLAGPPGTGRALAQGEDSALPAVPDVAAAAPAGTSFADVQGHWAQPEIEKWAELGLVNGAGGQFRPKDAISRAEFIKLANTLFGYQVKSSETFTDVGAGEWYAGQVSIARGAGYISGYPGGQFKPDVPVTRQEAAQMASRLFTVSKADTTSLAAFTDRKSIAAYAQIPLAGLVQAGYIKGFADGTIRPQQPITRAEALVLLDRLAGEILGSGSVYNRSKTTGNLFISGAGAAVTGTEIAGDVIVAPGVGDGDVTLDGVNLKGTLRINGGGAHSVHVNNSQVGSIIVHKPEGQVRVVIAGSSRVGEVNVQSGSAIEVGEKAAVTRLNVGEQADGTRLAIQGTVEELHSSSPGTTVNDKTIAEGTSYTVSGTRMDVKSTVPPAATPAASPTSAPPVTVPSTPTPAPAAPPAITADGTDNVQGKDITLSFTDNAAWRAAVQQVLLGSQKLDSGNYVIETGKLTIKASAINDVGILSVTIKASGYTDVTVLQLIKGGTPPQLAVDTTDHTLGRDIDITFTDDPVWREHIIEVKVGEKPLGKDTDYSLAPGRITFKAAVFTAPGTFTVTISAEQYAESAVATQQILSGEPPALHAEQMENVLGKDIAVTFTDNALWRNSISEVLWDETALMEGTDYQVEAGKIVVHSGAIQHRGTARLTVKAEGWADASVEQTIGEWVEVWGDEFDGTGSALDSNGVDLGKWAYQEGTGTEYGVSDWGNNEQEYYSRNNVQVAEGLLTITAKKESKGGKAYTSGRLWTSPTYSKTYGKFEARIKMPEGQGIWPAFWLMPKDSEYGTWASSGELDIMEARGRVADKTSGTIHFGKQWPNNKSAGGDYTFPAGQAITGFHTYSVEWEPGVIRWYVDGNLFYKADQWSSEGAGQPDKYAFPAPFDKPFYIILNMAIGGQFDGNLLPPDSAMANAKMQVDYVRVYDLEGKPYHVPMEPVNDAEPIPAEARQPVDGSYIADPNFEQGLTGISNSSQALAADKWNFLHTPDYGGAGSAAIEKIGGRNYAKITPTSGGNQNYALQLIQYAPLVKGHTYKISFDAKAAAARSMSVKMGGDADNGWSVYSDSYDASLKTDLQHYEFTFPMSATTDLMARLEFNVGLNTNALWIGNVRLEEITPGEAADKPKMPLDNGNHIYNGGFELGTMDRMKYWSFSAADGVASASVNPDTRELTVQFGDGGVQAQAVKLEQNGLNLLQGDTYQLKFSAKAAASRTIGVRFVSKDGSVEYHAETGIALGTSFADHTLSFTMPAQVSDTEGRLLFDLGGSDAAVTLDNVVLIRTTNHNVDYTGVELFPLKNGDFSSGLTAWEPFTQGAAATFSAAEGTAKIAVGSVGGEAWNIMLNQSNLQIRKGFTYVLSFEAKASIARDTEATLENSAYTRRFDSGFIALGTDWKHFEYTFKPTADDNVALKFLLGKTPQAPAAAHDVFFRNVVLEIQNAPVKRPPTLAADTTDTRFGQPITLTFKDDAAWRSAVTAIQIGGRTVEQELYEVQAGAIVFSPQAFASAGANAIKVVAEGYADALVSQPLIEGDGNLLNNGSFTKGTAGWEHWVGKTGDSTFEVKEGTANLQIHYNGGVTTEWGDPVPVSWYTQLMQPGIKLTGGKTYELSFRAWSTVNRPIVIELTGYNGDAKLEFHITGDASEVYTATLKPAADVTFALKFLLGNVVTATETTTSAEHLIQMDDISLREVQSGPALAADTTDNRLGQAIELTFADAEAWRTAITGIKINGTAADKEKYTVTPGHITLDASLFPAIASYTVAVFAEGYGANSIAQEVVTASPNVAIGKNASASTFKQPAALAFDGNAATRWESDSADPQWIAVDLGKAYRIDTVTLRWEGAYGKAYKLQVASAEAPTEADWIDVYSETAGNGNLDTIVVTPREARHVRLLGTSRGTPYGYSLWEFEVHGVPMDGQNPGGLTAPPALTADSTDNLAGQAIELDFAANLDWEQAITSVSFNGTELTKGSEYTVASGKITLAAGLFAAAGTYSIQIRATGYADAAVSQEVQAAAAHNNLALHRPVVASSSNATFDPNVVTDGNDGTRWEADYAKGHEEEWIYVDLGGVKDINQLVIEWERAYATHVDIQVADGLPSEPAGWTTVKSLDRNEADAAWTETVDVSDLNVKGRYVRLLMKGKHFDIYGPSIFEWSIY